MRGLRNLVCARGLSRELCPFRKRAAGWHGPGMACGWPSPRRRARTAMSRAHWFAVAFAACLAGAGCKDQTTDKAGASDLSKDVQSIPMNSKNNAALGGNNAPSANSPSPSPTTQAPATPAPQAAPAGQQPGAAGRSSRPPPTRKRTVRRPSVAATPRPRATSELTRRCPPRAWRTETALGSWGEAPVRARAPVPRRKARSLSAVGHALDAPGLGSRLG